MRRPSKELIRAWYQRIKDLDPDFVDIEGGRDLAQLNASTFRGGDGTRGVSFLRDDLEVTLEEVEDGRSLQLRDHPTAIYWRAVAVAANDLPHNHPRRAFILDAAIIGNVAAAARDHDLAPDQGDRVWWAFLSRARLPRGALYGSKSPTTPAPPTAARSLSPDELAQLQAQREPPPGPRRVFTTAEIKAERDRLRKQNYTPKTDGC